MAYGNYKKKTQVMRKPKSTIRKPRRTMRKRTVATSALKKVVKQIVSKTIETQKTLPCSVLIDSAATRTVTGDLSNPISTQRLGKAFPLVNITQQFPARGTSNYQFTGNDYKILSLNFAVSMYFNYSALFSKWRVQLVKVARRNTDYNVVTTQPFNVSGIYPDMNMEITATYARLWPKPVGTFEKNVGTVVWSKLLNLKELQKDFGMRTSGTYATFDGVEDVGVQTNVQLTSTTLPTTFSQNTNFDVYKYNILTQNMYFSIPINKIIRDETNASDIPNEMDRYSLFIYEEECAGRPTDFRIAPALRVEEIQTYTTFKDV